MNALHIEENIATPKVILDKDKGQFEISGHSLPENVLEFYNPIIKWIEEYLKQPNKQTEFHFRLIYFNSSSSKIILDLLNILDLVIKYRFIIFGQNTKHEMSKM